MKEPVIQIQSLTVRYGIQPALQDFSLDLQKGEVVALIGPNGAGKTTLIKAVSGVLRPAGGSLRVLGKDLEALSTRQRAGLIAVVPQARGLPEAYTVWETVLMGRTPYLGWLGQPGENDRERTRWSMARTEVLSLAERRIGELSGGEQQRVLLARAIAQETPVLLLDEPTAHLDLKYQSNLLKLVRELALEGELAVLMALHDLNLVALYADRVALLVRGQLRALGLPAEVLTADQLGEAFEIPLHVVTHPDYGTPLVLPDGDQPKK